MMRRIKLAKRKLPTLQRPSLTSSAMRGDRIQSSEMIPVPSHNHRRNVSLTGDNEANYARRITQRLSDVCILPTPQFCHLLTNPFLQMGFTANAYPILPHRINELIAAIKPRTKKTRRTISSRRFWRSYSHDKPQAHSHTRIGSSQGLRFYPWRMVLVL